MGRIHADTVRLIRKYYAAGYSIPDLAEHFGLQYHSAYRIARRLAYVKVSDVPDTVLPPLYEVKPRKPKRRKVRADQLPLAGEIGTHAYAPLVRPLSAAAQRQAAR